MSNIIDITVSLQPDMPVWPGSTGIRLTPVMRLEAGDASNVSRLDCDVHIGTHVDAPMHCLKNGSTVEQLPLDVMVGPAFVAYLPEVTDITPDDLSDLNVPVGTKRLLLHTRNSKLWAAEIPEFQKDYVALTDEAAQWVVEKGISLIGVDYLSVQRYDDNSLTHQILLKAGIVVLEGLNLANVEPGFYELVCLPLKLVDAEAAPTRVVLRSIAETSEELSAIGGGS